MVLLFLLMHFAPSIYWGATHSTFVAPLLWSVVGAGYSAFVKWRSRDHDLESAWASVSGNAKSMVFGAAVTGFLFSGALNVVGYLIGMGIVGSNGARRIVGSILVGYLLAGLHQVLCDLRRPVVSQPGYVRAGRASIASIMFGLLVWLPASFFNLRWSRGQTFLDTVFSWVTFVAAACALFLIV